MEGEGTEGMRDSGQVSSLKDWQMVTSLADLVNNRGSKLVEAKEVYKLNLRINRQLNSWVWSLK